MAEPKLLDVLKQETRDLTQREKAQFWRNIRTPLQEVIHQEAQKIREKSGRVTESKDEHRN